MKLNLDRILEKCPKKLLKLYPLITERIQLYRDTPEYLWEELEPLIILIPGSRGSGKTEWAVRAMIAGIYDGYIENVKYATMTENGLNGSKDAFERLAPECKGTGADTSKRNPMHRFISASRVDFDFFGKNDIKNEQHKYDVLICEEVEKWDKIQGVAALETEVRHCKVIILISNNPPQSVVDFCKPIVLWLFVLIGGKTLLYLHTFANLMKKQKLNRLFIIPDSLCAKTILTVLNGLITQVLKTFSAEPIQIYHQMKEYQRNVFYLLTWAVAMVMNLS